jgi:hypothetical protein
MGSLSHLPHSLAWTIAIGVPIAFAAFVVTFLSLAAGEKEERD